MLLRAFLAYIIHEYGVTVLIGSGKEKYYLSIFMIILIYCSIAVMVMLWAILRSFNIRLKLLWIMFNRSCC